MKIDDIKAFCNVDPDELFRMTQRLAVSQKVDFRHEIAKMLVRPERKTVDELMKPVQKVDGDRLPHYEITPPEDFIRWKMFKVQSQVISGHGINDIDCRIYLSEFLSDLGDNCIFEKGSTGCGGTTLTLNQNDRHVIIAMPTRNTVQSKEVTRDQNNTITGKRNDVFCIWSGHNDKAEELKGYLDRIKVYGEKVKIVCTYDQLGRLYDRLMCGDGNGNVAHGSKALAYNPLNWWLYIDEMHEVINAYQGERRESIRQMLDLVKVAKHVIFITATPLKEEYFFSQIFDQPNRFKVVKVRFPEWTQMKPQIVRRKTDKVIVSVAKEMKVYLKDEENLFHVPLNAHIFVNSLDMIISFLRRVDYLKNIDKIRIVCGQNDDRNVSKIVSFIKKEVQKKEKEGSIIPNKDIVDDILEGKVIPISSINDDPVRINFYTSTAFCGADIFDQKAQIYVVSTQSRKQTFYDISTTFLQIIGRVRDSKNPKIIYYYDNNPYQDKDKDEFLKEMETRKELQNSLLNLSPAALRLAEKDGTAEKNYITRRVDRHGNVTFVDDELLRFKDKLNWEVLNLQLSTATNMVAAFTRNNMNVSEECVIKEDEEAKQRFQNPTKRGTFEEKITQYYSLRNKGAHGTDGAVVEMLEKQYPEYKDIYDLYTLDEIKETGFVARAVIGERGILLEQRKLAKYKGNIIESLKLFDVVPGAQIDSKKKKAAEKDIMTKYGLKKFKIQDVFKVTSKVVNVNGKSKRLTIVESEI